MNVSRALAKWAMDNEIDYVYVGGRASCWCRILYCAERDALVLKLPDPAGRSTGVDDGYYVVPYDQMGISVPDAPVSLPDGTSWPTPSVEDYLWQTGQALDGIQWAISDYAYLGSDDRGVLFAGRIDNQFADAGGTVDVQGSMFVAWGGIFLTDEPTLP